MRHQISMVAACGEAIAYGQRIALPLALVRMQVTATKRGAAGARACHLRRADPTDCSAALTH